MAAGAPAGGKCAAPVLPSAHLARVAASREALLAAIGDRSDLTVIRGPGNVGDELIVAGIRRLLDDAVFREIGVEELARASGHTALIAGSGAFCRSYHDIMPRALAIAELRFDRVIVLPSSFDVSEDVVRDALDRTGATVFAREAESHRRISGLCDAHLALDCAFFCELATDAVGSGVLNAFRTDHESSGLIPRPVDNDDISCTSPSLASWLARIADHRLIRTDRAHVMIAAALMGREVEFGSCAYFKLEAIAEYALGDFPVRALAPGVERPPARSRTLGPFSMSPAAAETRERLRAAANERPPPPGCDALDADGDPRVTAIVLSHDRPELLGGAVNSLLQSTVPLRVVVIDNNSSPPARELVRQLCAGHPEIDLRLSDRNLGCAGGRRLGVELADSEYVLFLDDDAELLPGALEHLLATLDGDPSAAGVTALVVGQHGRVYHFGGWYRESAPAIEYSLTAWQRPFDDASVPGSGVSGWLPGTAALIRREIFDAFPIDDEMHAYYEDNEWSYRVERANPGSFRRCREALALHQFGPLPPAPPRFVEVARIVSLLACHAHFYRRHGLVLTADVFGHVPQLARADGERDIPAAEMLLEVVGSHSEDWVLMQWLNGGLDPLLAPLAAILAARDDELGALRRDRRVLEDRLQAQRRSERELQDRHAELVDTAAWLQSRHETLMRVESGGWWRLRGRLLPVLRPLGRLRRR